MAVSPLPSAGGGSGLPDFVPSNAQAIYVAKNGSDSNDGGPVTPFLTVAAALASITDATTSKPYVIFVGPGLYDEASLALKGNVYIQGCGGLDNLGCRIGVTGNLVTGDVSTIGGGGRYGIADIYFRGTTGLSIDLTTGGSGGSALVLKNVGFNGAVSYKARQNGDTFAWHNGICFAAVTMTGITNCNLFDCSLISTTTFQDSSVCPIKATVIGGQFNSVVVSTSHTTNGAPSTNFVNFFGGIYLPTLTVTQGAGTGVYSILEAGSYPFNGLTASGGATIYKSTGLHTLARDPLAISASDIDARNASTFTKTLSANTTFTISNMSDGQEIYVYVTNTASNYTVTWPTVKWSGGVAPTQTTGAKTDIYRFQKIGADIFGTVSQNHS